ncbi:MAG: nucleotidyl transferase AbiEii/AbiGii toxin family protein [Elusimicrobia bacterium]|nr:nucleotidyl transferase AbiEii/AbiGii toxin family protein [Candidatus Obscuribacterium magneticum]
MVSMVARGLGELRDNVVFIGGAVVSFYLKDEAVRDIRPTDDVDCLIEIARLKAYYDLEDELRRKGFRHSTEEGAPICRWIYQGIKVDVMPSDTSILGFSNRWYKEGLKNAVKIDLPDGQDIWILSLPFFVADKIDAFLDRGHGDFRLSRDIEDVVTVLDGQPDFQEFLNAPQPVKRYLVEKFKEFLPNPLFLECLTAHLTPDPAVKERARRIRQLLQEMIASP